jgi:hypothetical protein
MRVAAALLGLGVLIAACGAGAAVPTPSSPATGAAASPPGQQASASAAPAAAGVGGTAAGGAVLGERSNEGGGVEVKAAWISTEPPALKITLDTHSVDLDAFDLARLVKLRIDGGSWVAPSAVDVPKGGHHREGRLQFTSIAAAFGAARLIELEIAEVAIPTRSFRWERGA